MEQTQGQQGAPPPQQEQRLQQVQPVPAQHPPRPRARGSALLHSLPQDLEAQLLHTVSKRGGYTHALVCRRWAAVAPSSQALVRVRGRALACGGEILQSLRRFPNLRVLDLSQDPDFTHARTNLHLQQSQLPALEELSLCLHVAGAVDFEPLRSLRSLTLKSTHEDAPGVPETLSNLTGLTALEVDRSYRLARFSGPPSWLLLSRLCKLRKLTWDCIDDPIPAQAVSALAGLADLALRLTNFPISAPPGLSSFTRLERLVLRAHCLFHFPELADMASLRELDLDYGIPRNGGLPSDLGRLSNLERLSVPFDAVGIPSLNLGMLTQLRASEGFLSAVPPGSLSRLTELDLDRVNALPECVRGLTSVKKLSISCRHGETADLEALSTLLGLEELSIDFIIYGPDFELEVMPPWWLASLRNLQTLFTSFTEACGSLKHVALKGLRCPLEDLAHLSLPPTLVSLKLVSWEVRVGGGGHDWELDAPLPVLRRLTLKDIKGLAALPRNLGSLKGLTQLRLEDLPLLEELPASFPTLTGLEQLYIRSCPGLKRMPRGSDALPCFSAHPELLLRLDLY